MLPGPTFVKTFLRTYAEALGLDPQVLVEEYRATYESRDEIEQLQPLGPTAVRRDRRPAEAGPPRGPWLLIGAGRRGRGRRAARDRAGRRRRRGSTASGRRRGHDHASRAAAERTEREQPAAAARG